jgi:hypothetical protein
LVSKVNFFQGLLSHFAASCAGGGFLGFPTWYHYLPKEAGTCSPALLKLDDIWLIVAAVIEILLRVAGIVAVILIIYGGFSYVASQGEPDKTRQAQGTIVNALIGLAIAVVAAATVAFIAGSIT